MFKQFLPILTLISLSVFSHSVVQAQDFVKMAPLPDESVLQTRSLVNCRGVANAGITARTRGLRAKTNDVRFLCAGDTLFVNNSQSNLTEDPIPATTSGIGYLFYNCAPSVSGPRWSNVAADRCLTLDANRRPFIARGDAQGRDTFVNTGDLQRIFNGNRPVKFYFAAATVYDYLGINSNGVPSFENDTACVNINVGNATARNDTFSVVYLNAINAKGFKVTGNRAGTITPFGGLPEYDPTARYTIIIQKQNTTTRGTVQGSFLHNAPLTFTVPEDGTYDIIITDGKACDYRSTVTFPTVKFTLSNECVNNTENVCVRVIVDSFTNINNFGIYVKYDPSVLTWDEQVRNPNTAVASGVSVAAIDTDGKKDTIFISWVDFGGKSASLPANSTLINLCFTARGTNGTTTPLSFVDDLDIPTEVINNKLDALTLDTIPGSVRIGVTALNIFKDSTATRCDRPNSGRFRVALTGSREAYSLVWRSPTDPTLSDTLTFAAGDTAVVNNLPAGKYLVTVTTPNCGIKIDSLSIPTGAKPTVRFQTKDATCAERADGRAKAIPTLTGGLTATYNWARINGILDSITNVKPDTYRVRITLSNGCATDTFTVVKSPDSLLIDTVEIQKPICPEDGNGLISIVMQGGTPDYTFKWSGGAEQKGNVFASLSAGKYTFTITDANNCGPITREIELLAPPTIKLAFRDTAAVSCAGVCNQGQSDGRATVVATEGAGRTGVFLYNWASGEDIAAATMLCGGWQRVTVTDDAGCSITDSVRIGEPEPISFLTPIIEEPACNGDNNGSISVEQRVEGGTGVYTYAWSGGSGSTTAKIENITAGIYSLVVTDDKNCASLPLAVEVNEPEPFVLDTIVFDTNSIEPLTRDVSCAGLDDGQITVQRKGGNPGGTTYKWTDNVSQTDKAVNLKAGRYSVTATDAKGCSDDITVEIDEPAPISYTVTPPLPPLCNGDQTTIRLDTAFGGTGLYPFTISVDNGADRPSGVDVPLFAGEHFITITEQITGCTDTFSIFVDEPPRIEVFFNNIVDSIPFPRMLVGLGSDTARIDPVINSALPLDSIVWSPTNFLTFKGDTLRPFVRPLDDQTYKLRVIDVNGCEGEGTVIVELERNRNIFVPNVFSPNEDGINDFFDVSAGQGVKSVNYLRIFNRWGELLYARGALIPGNDLTQGWDGRVGGNYVGNGVFVYVAEVEFEDGQKLIYRGDITVAR